MATRRSLIGTVLERFGLRDRRSQKGIKPSQRRAFSFEPLERRELLSVAPTCVWINDNWVDQTNPERHHARSRRHCGRSRGRNRARLRQQNAHLRRKRLQHDPVRRKQRCQRRHGLRAARHVHGVGHQPRPGGERRRPDGSGRGYVVPAVADSHAAGSQRLVRRRLAQRLRDPRKQRQPEQSDHRRRDRLRLLRRRDDRLDGAG